MAKKSDTVNQEKEQNQTDQNLKHENALKALRRLRDIGKQLPAIDAAVIVRESRDLAGHGSR